MKALSQMHPPKFPLSMAQGTEAALINVLHALFFHEVMKISSLMPHSLFSVISNQSTKGKVYDRE